MLGKLSIYMQKTKTDPYLSYCTKINSKVVKNLIETTTGEKRETSGRYRHR
jgi:hypothetical protein